MQNKIGNIMTYSKLLLSIITLFLFFGTTLIATSCKSNKFKQFDSLSDYEVSEKLILDLENGNYQFVESYFDFLLSSKKRNKNGEKKLDYIYNKIAERNKGNENSLFTKWCENSSHYSAYTVKGHFYIIDGWRDRGTNFAKDTSAEQFRLFHEKLAIAKQALDEAYKRNTKDINIHYGMMKICRGLGLSDQELESWYTRALSIDPSSYNIYKEKLNNLLPKWGGSWEEAYNYSSSLLKKSPKGSLAYLTYLEFMQDALYSKKAQRYAGNKSYNEQLDEVQKIEDRLFSEFPESEFRIVTRKRLKGGYYFMLNQPVKAEQSFKKIIEEDPDYHWAWYMLGQLYQKSLHKPKEAIEYFTKAIQLDPDTGMYYDERGSAAFSAKDYDLCISDLTRSTESGSTFYHSVGWITYFQRGTCLQKKGKHYNAIEDFTTAIVKKPKQALLLNKRAESYYETDQLKKAISDLKRSLQIYSGGIQTPELLKRYETELKLKEGSI